MRLVLLVGLAALLAGRCAGQTQKIAFESHSGAPENFLIAISDDFFNTDESDFGLPPKEVKQYRLDSVILLSDSIAVLITTEYSRSATDPVDSMKFAGIKRDTVLNDLLFSRKHSLDSIRTVLAKDHYYINSSSLRKVKFIGYDNKKPTTLKNNIVPLTHVFPAPPADGPPTVTKTTILDTEALQMLFLVFGFALLGAFLTWKFYRPGVQKV
jgi:hypothetical protein